MRPLRICLISAEVTPLAKTGGLGDVTAALARYLWRQGQDVRLFFPFYSVIEQQRHTSSPVAFIRQIPLRLAGRHIHFTTHSMRLPGTDQEVYPIECPAMYGRPGLYASDGDEHLRFTLLGRAAIESCQRMGWAPDVFHCNDWHSALVPLDLKTVYSWDSLLASSKTLLTIHNIGYQGVFPATAIEDLGLSDHAQLLQPDDWPADRLNFLLAGVLHADLLSTVSPTHAREIQTEEYGMGLEALLRQRSGHLVGILNGVDYEIWNPAADSLIPYHYSIEDLEGKEWNKKALLEELGLPYDPRAPALGMITRLVAQKGIDLLAQVLPDILPEKDLRLVALGSGEAKYESFFQGLQEAFPRQVRFYRGYNNDLAHRIEASCDLFLMPSLYEPCGLNQMYSLRYGTVPIVRQTGGLADAVELFDPASGEGTGVVFEHPTADALRRAIDFALELYGDRTRWRQLIHNGMSQDFSWERQIDQYIELYTRLAGG
jgi:starch synthase